MRISDWSSDVCSSDRGEPVGDLVITASTLQGVEPDPARAPSMIDEYPVTFIAAALAEGRSTFRGLEELRVKESDRIATMAAGLRAIGVTVEELEDGRSEEHTSELQSLMRISSAAFCL